MLIFNEYFGYRDSQKSAKRRLKRTEISCEKLAHSQHHTDQHKKNIQSSHFFIGRPRSVESPLRNRNRTLRSSPFKSVRKRSNLKERKSLKPAKKITISQHEKHMYDRFMKEDFKTKTDSVESKRDSQILNFLRKKEIEKDESLRRSQKQIANLPSFKIKNQNAHSLKRNNSDRKLFPQKISWRDRTRPNNGTTQRSHNRRLYANSPINKDIGANIFASPTKRRTNLYLQNFEEDEYQIKSNGKQRLQNSDSLKLWKSIELDDKNNRINQEVQMGFQSVEFKINKHYQELQKILYYVEKIKKFHSNQLQIFDRQIYLCRKMYYHSICQMKDCLKQQPLSINCFKLILCNISDEQLKKYLQITSTNLGLRIRQLQSQIQAMKESLSEQSEQLSQKYSNDPYIKFDNHSFQPELVNQINEQIQQLEEKIHFADGVKKQEIIKRQNDAIGLIFLVAELCGLGKIIKKMGKKEGGQKMMGKRQILEQVIQKFQLMPL